MRLTSREPGTTDLSGSQSDEQGRDMPTSTTSQTRVRLGNEHGYGLTGPPFSISVHDLLRHAYVIGQTGVGKSTALYNIALQLIVKGEGVAFLDPHGQEATSLLDAIPRDRTRHVVYFNPQNKAHPVGINLLETDGDQNLAADSVVEALRGLHANSWGPRMEWILYNTLRTIAAAGGTVLDVPTVLTDRDVRATMVGKVENPAVRSFWEDEFANYDKRFRTNAISPIQNKVGRLRADPVLRGILGQRHSTIDPGFMMDERRILIADLSGIGIDAADILGSFLSAWFQLKAPDRDESGHGRPPFTLIMDECHRFTTDGLASILAESRKYGLGMVLANQYTAQLTDEIQDAIFGNVGTTIAYRLGGADAEVLSEHFGGRYRPKQFTDLDQYRAYVKAIQDGKPKLPTKATMLPPIEHEVGRKETIVRESRRRFSRKREVVTKDI